MVSGSSNECSTDFEASTSVASAESEEQYDDEFDDYSDSFESDNEVSVAPTSNSTGFDLLRVGTRVQVFWREENEWFDGEIQCVNANEPHYFVHYNDGEEQWEGPSSIRPLPTTTAQYDQMQQLLPLNVQDLVGRSVIVYWPDEGEWYNGVISSAQASPAALEIEYDDGDSRWEQ
ncbi:Hypothetical protein PHPALM_15551, partial [Phytophthora palmivora]